MPRNGSGSYSPPGSDFPAVAATTIESTKYNNVINDLGSALTGSIAANGETTITANIPMSGFKITGCSDGSSSTDVPTMKQIQNQSPVWCGTAGGTANALTLTPSPAITAYVTGQCFVFKSGSSASSSTVTVAISGLSTIAIQSNGIALSGGEISANKWYRITLDSTSTCQLEQIRLPEAALFLTGGNLTGGANFAISTVASAATPDIFATTIGNIINYTGTATATGFATAPQGGATRILMCAGASVFTAGANMLISGVSSGSNYTASANDAIIVFAETTTKFHLIPIKYSGAALAKSSGDVVQVVNSQDGAVASVTTTLPYDDTIPQNSEGEQIMSVSITPISASNTLLIDVVINGSSVNNDVRWSAGLFQDSIANALAAASVGQAGQSVENMSFKYKMTAGTTSAITFKVRAGANAGNWVFNGYGGPTRIFGGVAASSITVTEISA